MFTCWSSCCCDVKDLFYDTEGSPEGQCGCTRGLIWVHVWADMGSHERAVMALESRAVSVRVTKHFVTIYSKTCNKLIYLSM